MKTATEAAQAALRNPENSPSSTAYDEIARLNKRASKLWLRMGELYGHKWTSQMGTAPSELWLKALSALSDDQISAGLNACLHSDDTWPPSLPEFVNRCRPPRRENAAMYSTQPRLPSPTSAPEKAREHLAAMKAQVAAVLAADSAKPKPATHAGGIDDHAWFASHLDLATNKPWDYEAPYRDRGICRDFPSPAERAQQERQDKAA